MVEPEFEISISKTEIMIFRKRRGNTDTESKTKDHVRYRECCKLMVLGQDCL